MTDLIVLALVSSVKEQYSSSTGDVVASLDKLK